jgi:glycosyltransferase involved in cell wall biosynthesis
MARQTLLPMRWIVVNDGSTDGTAAVLDAFAADHDWMTVVHRSDRGHRANGSGVMEAFHSGLEALEGVSWDYLVKLDADLSFRSDYFERCLDRFEAEPALGIGGGTVCVSVGGVERPEVTGDPPFHVRGATKIYREACWRRIAPLIRAPGWDTVDEVRANLFGWHSRTFAELCVTQHKPTGGADGLWRNALKNGKANYMTGYHPAFMFAKCIKRLRWQSRGLECIGLLAGYLSGYVRQVPMLADRQTVRYLRGQQLRRLLLRSSIYG